MAVYFDHKIQAPGQGGHTLSAWHSNFPILAVASSATFGGSVNLYMEEGDLMQDVNISKDGMPTALCWHPHKKALAVGWDAGYLQIWTDTDKACYEVNQQHFCEITSLNWTGNGSRLVSCDASGQVIMWKADSRGRLQQTPLCSHPLQERVSQVVLRPPLPIDPSKQRQFSLYLRAKRLRELYNSRRDLQSLARAAVSGDEAALDMFNWKKGKGQHRLAAASFGPQEANCFFIGGNMGGVFYLNEQGKCMQVFNADGPVHKLLFYEDKSILVTITTSLMLSQHSVSLEGDCREILKIKMSGKSSSPVITWAGKGILATATGESIVRMWDVDKEENFVLNLEGQSGYSRDELITCIAYSNNKGVLAGGTTSGHVAMWKYAPALGSAGARQEPEEKWKLQPPSQVDGSVAQLTWGSSKNLLSVNTTDNVYILTEQIMSSAYRQQLAVVQTGPNVLSVHLYETRKHHDLRTDIQIKHVSCTKEAIAITNGSVVVVYEVSGDVIRAAGTFGCESPVVYLYEQNVYTLEPGKVQVRTFQGTVKQLITFTEMEGDPIQMDIHAQYLVISSSNGFVKVYDLSRREAKQHAAPIHFAEVIPEFGSIYAAKCNCNATKVAVVTNKTDGTPDPHLYIWDVETNKMEFFNFESGRGEQDELYMNETQEEDASALDKGKLQAAKDIAGRLPISLYWDPSESKLVVCEARLMPQAQHKRNAQNQKDSHHTVSLTKATMEETVEVMVVCLFATPENGILIQDSFAMSQIHNRIIGMDTPYFYFMKKSEEAKNDSGDDEGFSHTEEVMEDEFGAPLTQRSAQANASGSQRIVQRRIMRDFVGLENADKNARDAMMNFSYYLTIGNMDEAFKAIKLIKSESVWENMAKMCVKTRRLDVATVCLGNMGHARGAKFLREALKEPELDAKVAMLAIQLGLGEDAERLLKNCKRYDMLNELYQNTGQWGKALETAEMYDRVHLRTTYYNYARHLESKGDINAAIPNFEKSDTHRFEVPRMLFDEPQALESYIMKTKDKALRKWWAQYMESTGEMETALQFYEAAQDFLSLVRVHCYCGNLERAAEICNETGDRAACYHMARQYENSDNIKEAIHFFTRAQAYGNAIRLCKEHGMEDQMMNLALLGTPENMIEAARYYEYKPNRQDKAVLLYQKAGNFSKALDLAFTTKQFGALQMISEDLDDKTDPELLQRCADFFIDNGQYDRAVDLLAAARKYWDALKLCMEQHVPVSEDLVEKLTPDKDLGENEMDERNKILEGIAEVCMQQRQYHLATKKYTQAGNRVKAMKALLKSGDTEKIVFFAGVSRQKEIYVMAASYLQSLDWRKDPEIMKNIISFYTKGRALELLAGFYDACAMVEIDEYQNYDKALGALNEAFKCLTKAKMKNESLQEEKLGELKNKMTLIKKFVTAKRTYEQDADEAIKQCQVLLEETGLDSAVRMGDVYGFLVEHFARREKWKTAYQLMEEMRNRIPKLNMGFYVNNKTIEAVHRALDIPLNKNAGLSNGFRPGSPGNEEDGEEVEEDVIDDYRDDS